MSESDAARRVVVALSGGVDSAVAALLLVERGYDVIAVTLRLRADQPWGAVPAPDAVARARSVSNQLSIPFRVIDAQKTFQREVVAPFIAAYAAGRTPNPCVRCNQSVRFGFLLERALAMSAGALATGHYARVREIGGRYQLLRGQDRRKDQSYFLYRLTQAQLAHVLFPLGELTKQAVRDIARERGPLPTDQAESQDICFLGEEDYRRLLAEEAPYTLQPGPIRDTSGRVLGQHHGLAAYTIGQRKGLGIAAAQPLYVLSIRPEENALIVGTAKALERDACCVEAIHIISGQEPRQPFRAQAQIRYRAEPAGVMVQPLPGGRARVTFDIPQRGITPGQSLVLYEEDVVLGGGIICVAQNSVL